MPDYRYLLSERDIPKTWYNVIPDLPAPMSPPLHPGTLQPAGPQDLEAIFPHRADRAGGHGGAEHSHPRTGSRHPATVAAHAVAPRDTAGEGAGDSRQNLLQERRSLTRRQPQAQHGHRPGVLQQGRRRQAPDHGNGRGTVGQRAGARLQRVRHGVHGLHGEVQLLSEAASPHHDGMLGREMRSFPQRPDASREEDSGGRPGNPGQPRASPSAKRWKTPPRRKDTNYSLGSVLNHVLLHQTVIGQEAIAQMKLAGAIAGHRHRLLRRRKQFRRAGIPVCAGKGRGQEHPPDRRGARRVPSRCN